MSLLSPWWLIGLAALPLIRWLHRGGRPRRAVTVPHLGLWQGPAVSPAQAGRRTPPDPAWRRRALLAGLLLLALAQPQWPRGAVPVTVWVDDSLSMLTRETGGTRLATGLAQLRAALAEAGTDEVELRTLGQPWQRLDARDGLQAEGLATRLAEQIARGAQDGARPPPQPPPAALLDPRRQHWLLTDAAHPPLLGWPAGAGPGRVLQVGRADRNVGLQRAAARRVPGTPQQVELLFKVHNGGRVAEQRSLQVRGPAGELIRTDLRLDPGASAWVPVALPWAARVGASLQPADALAEDDSLVLDLAPLAPVGVAVDAACPDALRLRLASHPALALLAPAAAGAAAQVRCRGAEDADTTQDSPPALPTLQLLIGKPGQPQPGPWQWAAGVPAPVRQALAAQALSLGGPLAARPGDEVLLAVSGQPLLVRRAGPRPWLETRIDLADPQAGAGPGLPLLVNLVFEQLLQRPLLGPLAELDRGTDAAAIAPQPLPAPGTAAPPAAAAQRLVDGSWPLLALAALLLLWDLVALGRQALRRGEA